MPEDKNQVVQTETVSLAEADLQQIQLELIRRASFKQFDGNRVAADLLRYRRLWRGALMESSNSLVTLRDMVEYAHRPWNVDTLYILAADHLSAVKLYELAEAWNADTVEICFASEANDLLGTTDEDWWLVQAWWD